MAIIIQKGDKMTWIIDIMTYLYVKMSLFDDSGFLEEFFGKAWSFPWNLRIFVNLM